MYTGIKVNRPNIVQEVSDVSCSKPHDIPYWFTTIKGS